MKRRYFDTPFTIFEEKKFASLKRDNEFFLRSQMQETHQYLEKLFLKTGFTFHMNYEIFVKITGPLYTECQAFSPVVQIGSPRPLTRKLVSPPPPPWFQGGGGHTLVPKI